MVKEYDRVKLFVLVNLRSYVSDEDMGIFPDSILQREYQVLLIESSERKLLEKEKKGYY